jgi:hypothetical protein
MYYFKSTYQPCSYSPNWYGTFSYAPSATVLMYDDKNLFCIGIMDEIIGGVEYISEVEAQTIIDSSEGEQVFKGEKLLHRWDVVEDG